MSKAIGGDGWAFRPADGDKPAIWAGKESIYNIAASPQENAAAQQVAGTGLALGCVCVPILFIVGQITGGGSGDSVGYGIIGLIIFAGLIGAIMAWGQPKWKGNSWELVANGDWLYYSVAGVEKWKMHLRRLSRVESGRTIEWAHARDYNGKKRAIPDAEMQVFLFLDDGRRLVVHTANAAREDCGRLAHSIRSYVDAQKGGASPAPATSSPAADGFDL